MNTILCVRVGADALSTPLSFLNFYIFIFFSIFLVSVLKIILLTMGCRFLTKFIKLGCVSQTDTLFEFYCPTERGRDIEKYTHTHTNETIYSTKCNFLLPISWIFWYCFRVYQSRKSFSHFTNQQKIDFKITKFYVAKAISHY